MPADEDSSVVVEQEVEGQQKKRARIPNSADKTSNGNRADIHNIPEDITLPSQLLRSRIKDEKYFVKLVKKAGHKISTASPVWRYDYFRIASLVNDWENKEIGKDFNFILIFFYSCTNLF
jgi:hypothetical protein